MILRFVTPQDCPALLDIYAQYIDTGVTFEYDLPTREEFTARISGICRDYPYLVCQEGDRVLGYAYAHRVWERAAYQWNAELSVYLAPDDGKVPDGQTRERPSCLHSPLPAVLPMEVDVRTFDGFICQWLGDCIQALPPENHALREFLRQYQALCKTL